METSWWKANAKPHSAANIRPSCSAAWCAPDDVAADNTVYSYNVADATIQIIGKGTVTDSQNKGWFTRVWDKLNPF